jgi:sugar lactone lactonase YvrE
MTLLRSSRRLAHAAAALLACGACSSGDSTNAAPTGSLTVTITAPAGVTPAVTVIHPDGSTDVIASTQGFPGLPVGVYGISAGPGVTADPIVSTAYNAAVTGNPATITNGANTMATVTYTSPRAATGVLWVTNVTGNTVTGFSPANLGATGSPTPAVLVGNGLSSSTVKAPGGVAVDSAGGIWVTEDRDSLKYFTAAQVATSTNAAPARRLTSSALRSAVAIALDAAGDLWVVDQFNATLNEFTPAQLAAGGTQTPAVIVNKVFGTLARPWQAAFDAHGNLWVVNFADSTVVAYSPAQLAAGGDPVPFAGLSGSKGISNCFGLAFDAQGNLWISTLNDTIAKFNASDLTTIGAPAPSVIITGASLGAPIALAFDNSGALWVSNFFTSTLVKYNSSQLASTGSPTPAVTISNHAGSLSIPQGIAFSPASAALPVK